MSSAAVLSMHRMWRKMPGLPAWIQRLHKGAGSATTRVLKATPTASCISNSEFEMFNPNSECGHPVSMLRGPGLEHNGRHFHLHTSLLYRFAKAFIATTVEPIPNPMSSSEGVYVKCDNRNRSSITGLKCSTNAGCQWSKQGCTSAFPFQSGSSRRRGVV